jgi:plasmid maintenance system antidote protein VapI
MGRLYPPNTVLFLALEKRRVSTEQFFVDLAVCGYSRDQLERVLIGAAPIDVAFSRHLANYLDTDPEYWITLQYHWDRLIASVVVPRGRRRSRSH